MKITDDIYTLDFLTSNSVQEKSNDKITDKDKFLAAKQILLGLAILYVLTLVAYLCRPHEGEKLLDICTTTFPPLATLILVAYFRDRHH